MKNLEKLKNEMCQIWDVSPKGLSMQFTITTNKQTVCSGQDCTMCLARKKNYKKNVDRNRRQLHGNVELILLNHG